MKKYLSFLFLAVFVFLLVGEVAAGKPPTRPSTGSLTVSPYFTSHMVLQRGDVIPVFGTATADSDVTVSFNGKTIPTVASPAGKWQIDLGPMVASDMSQELVVTSGSATVKLTDVLIGDVWLLSGQSNINLPLWKCIGGLDAVNSIDSNSKIRLYMSALSGVGTTGRWLLSNPTDVQNWSGVGFFFALALRQLDSAVPVGLIQIARNGSSIDEWTTFGGNSGRYYNGNIVPLQPMAIRGVIWYQGETEANPEEYYSMLPGLIGNWRADWGQENLPFFVVQLAPISGRDYYAVIRDAQVSTLNEDKGIYMACIIDVDTVPSTAIHPPDKKPVGERLALIVRNRLYDEESVVYSGPIRNKNLSATIGDGRVIVGFDHVEGGLLTIDGTAPGPFLLAGSNGVYWAATTAKVVGDTVEVSSTSVPNPVSVRYGWAAYPQCNLFNGWLLPASPFELTFP
jgi:sialate O-acetylesterase